VCSDVEHHQPFHWPAQGLPKGSQVGIFLLGVVIPAIVCIGKLPPNKGGSLSIANCDPSKFLN